MTDRKTIFISGGTGMVGRNLFEKIDHGAFHIVSPTSQELDLTDRNQVQEFLSDYMPDFVVHLAGRVGGIQANIAEPYKFAQDNLSMGLNLIDCSFQLGIQNFLNIGSSCMYPADRTQPLSEDMILDGKLEPTNEGYALAKIVNTRLCEYINRSTQLNYKTVIPCNLYGRYDHFEETRSHLVAAIINKVYFAKINNEETIAIWGDGSARREFMYAGDLADMLLIFLTMFNRLPPVLNLGCQSDHSVLEYYDTVAKLMNWQGEFVFDRTKPVGMLRKKSDISKMKDLGLCASTSLEDGLRQTIQYFEELNETG